MFFAHHTFHRVLVCLLCCLAGCAKSTVTVNALSVAAGDAPPGIHYSILPGMAEIRADDLQFLEYKAHLVHVLRELGLMVTDNDRQATATVLFSYHTREIGAYADNGGPSVGIGIGSSSRGHRGGSFFGLGIGVPIASSHSDAAYCYTVVLDAVTGTPGGADKNTSLWKVTLTAERGINNLRGIMPAMLNAAKPYIGKHSQGPVTVAFEEVPR